MGCCDSETSCDDACFCGGELDGKDIVRVRALEERQDGVTRELQLLRGEVRDLLANPRAT